MNNINEVVVISGKGGTGKTSIVASVVPFIEGLVIADCDVDAPDLNILFGETVKESIEFIGTQKAYIDKALCNDCGKCIDHCKFDAISDDFVVNNFKCEGCGVCEVVCKRDAITMVDTVVGSILISDTKYGEMVHGKLIPGEETSGKLVAQVRNKAKELAAANNITNVIIDGSPGIACNVISSITGAKKVVIVIEASLSGLHDLKRVYEVTKKFDTSASVIINKWDLSPELSNEIESFCASEGIQIDFKIPFDKVMVEAIANKQIPSVYAPDFFENLNFKHVVKGWFV
jgi:MinD superfamily P-loop ATPase